MASREHKRGSSLREKFQLLRSITNSHAENETSIIVDASKYIKKLKKKVENINNETTSEPSFYDPTNPMVTVETLENKVFMINVMSEKNESGMLVCVLEAFEDLGLEVIEARVSCTDSFSLHAIGSSNNDDGGSLAAEEVKQAVAEAIMTWGNSHNPKG